MDNNVTYIEKKISCPSCKTGIEFAIKLNNVNLVDVKLTSKCSNCGAEIIFTPSSLIGIVNENKFENKYVEEQIIPPLPFEESEIEIPSEINSFFEDIEEETNNIEKIEAEEMEENKKKRKYINDIFS